MIAGNKKLLSKYEEIERYLIRFGGPEEAKLNYDSWNFLRKPVSQHLSSPHDQRLESAAHSPGSPQASTAHESTKESRGQSLKNSKDSPTDGPDEPTVCPRKISATDLRDSSLFGERIRREHWDKISLFNFFKDVSEPENSQTLPRNFSDSSPPNSLSLFTFPLPLFFFFHFLFPSPHPIGFRSRNKGEATTSFWIRFLCGCSENRATENSESSRLWTFVGECNFPTGNGKFFKSI